MNLRTIDEIPACYQSVFSSYPCFNIVQSEVFETALNTDKNLVVSAPTGSGKTVIFEFAIIRILMSLKNEIINDDFKIVYISPIKSLCQEKLTDWFRKFSQFQVKCVSITGDSEDLDFNSLIHHNLILSTPEKWDSLTRKWRDHEKLVNLIKLFMIDEVHLLNEENRGSTLEVIVSRMKTIENCYGSSADHRIRFVAVSATIPNIEDIAGWIGKAQNTEMFKFSEDIRPVQLKKIVLGYPVWKNLPPFKFDLSLNYKLQQLILQYSDGKPTLIFCCTRKSAEMAVQCLVQNLQIYFNEYQRKKLNEVSKIISDDKLKSSVRHGICFHHAGLIPETRHIVEELFRGGDLPILVTTSTLSMGVNLPAHLVIIKSTKCYDSGGFRDYTETQIQQMIGRAGRPQFDVTATALILTSLDDKPKFEKMVGGTEMIESNLHRHLTEHLNAEVVLRTITDLDVAMRWLASTFLYVRARKNPKYYGLPQGLTKEQIDKKILEMCQIDLNKLTTAGMLKLDQDIMITPTPTGQIMAKYYIAFGTMKSFTHISGYETMIQILSLISKCCEFSELRLRTNDKKFLNIFNKNSKKDTIRFPLNGRIKTSDMKVNCLIQAVLGNMEIHDHSLLTESWNVTRNSERIVKCLVDYLVMRKKNCYSALLHSIILAKCLKAKIWENSPYVSKQLSGIGPVLSTQLVNAGKTSFDKILQSNPRDLEIIIKKKPPLGDLMMEEVKHIPRYDMTMKKLPGSNSELRITISLLNFKEISEKCTLDLKSGMILLVGDSSNEILHYEKYYHSLLLSSPILMRIIKVGHRLDDNYVVTANFISENWVGIDCSCSVPQNAPSPPKPKKQETAKKQQATKKQEKKGKNPIYMQTLIDHYMKNKGPEHETDQNKSKKEMAVKYIQLTAKNAMSSNNVNTNNPSGNTIGNITDGQNFIANEIHGSTICLKPVQLKNDGLAMVPLAKQKVQYGESCPADSTTFIHTDSSLQSFAREVVKEVNFDSAQNLHNDNKHTEQNSSNDATENSSPYDKEDGNKLQNSTGLLEETKVNLRNLQRSVIEERNLFGNNSQFKKNPLFDRMVQKYTSNDGDRGTLEVGVHVGNRKRKVDDQMDHEISLEKFKMAERKKHSHTEERNCPKYGIKEILEPPQGQKADGNMHKTSNKKTNGQVKSIKWRSPLVSSPRIKYSPKIGRFRQNSDSENTEEEEGSPASRRSNMSLVINVQKTPKQKSTPKRKANPFMKIVKPRGTQFLLSDDDFNNSTNNGQDIEAFSDLLSPTLLNDFKSTPKKKQLTQSKYYVETGTPNATDYYSQLVPKSDMGRSNVKNVGLVINESPFFPKQQESNTSKHPSDDGSIVTLKQEEGFEKPNENLLASQYAQPTQPQWGMRNNFVEQPQTASCCEPTKIYNDCCANAEEEYHRRNNYMQGAGYTQLQQRPAYIPEPPARTMPHGGFKEDVFPSNYNFTHQGYRNPMPMSPRAFPDSFQSPVPGKAIFQNANYYEPMDSDSIFVGPRETFARSQYGVCFEERDPFVHSSDKTYQFTDNPDNNFQFQNKLENNFTLRNSSSNNFPFAHLTDNKGHFAYEGNENNAIMRMNIRETQRDPREQSSVFFAPKTSFNVPRQYFSQPMPMHETANMNLERNVSPNAYYVQQCNPNIPFTQNVSYAPQYRQDMHQNCYNTNCMSSQPVHAHYANRNMPNNEYQPFTQDKAYVMNKFFTDFRGE